ncbi:hypothetical protein BH10PSE7_BH10PSE7_22050 [soil metagenome]
MPQRVIAHVSKPNPNDRTSQLQLHGLQNEIEVFGQQNCPQPFCFARYSVIRRAIAKLLRHMQGLMTFNFQPSNERGR